MRALHFERRGLLDGTGCPEVFGVMPLKKARHTKDLSAGRTVAATHIVHSHYGESESFLLISGFSMPSILERSSLFTSDSIPD